MERNSGGGMGSRFARNEGVWTETRIKLAAGSRANGACAAIADDNRHLSCLPPNHLLHPTISCTHFLSFAASLAP